MSLLSVQSVSKSFGGLQALKDVSIDVEAGRTHGLMGANGAGKTTLFSIIAGNLRASGGSVVFDGQAIGGLRPDQICRLGIARTFQIVRPFAGMTVRENVETALLFGRHEPPAASEIRDAVDQVLEETGLSAMAESLAATLTLSARKRLELARAVGTGPRLLLLDEVMAGLTPSEVGAMIDTIRRIKRRYGLTILIIEHVVGALTEMSETITVLHHGERIAQGSPGDIANDPHVLSAYFGEEQHHAAP